MRVRRDQGLARPWRPSVVKFELPRHADPDRNRLEFWPRAEGIRKGKCPGNLGDRSNDNGSNDEGHDRHLGDDCPKVGMARGHWHTKYH